MSKNLLGLLKENGHETFESHDEKYLTIARLLGFEEVKSCVPFTLDKLIRSYKNDEHFNNKITPLSKWDAASGFYTNNRTGDCGLIGSYLTYLYRQKGVNAYSCSDGVCILKSVARYMVLEALKGE